MKNISALIARAFILTLVLGMAALPKTASAQIAPPALVRTWTASSGLVKLVIARSGSTGYTVHAWGQCSPTPCDWGTVPLTVYAPTVTGRIANAGTATFTTGFDVVGLVLHLDGTVLSAETFTHFTDHSARSNYHVVTVLH